MNILLYIVLGYLAIGLVFSMMMALSYKYSKKTKENFDEYMDENNLNKEMIPNFIVASILFWGFGVVKAIKNRK